jgi:DNA-binding NarL/FixJ family response regulator
VNDPEADRHQLPRVLIVGAPDDRARLRGRLNGALVVIGEFATLREAASSGIEADAIVTAPSRGSGIGDRGSGSGDQGSGSGDRASGDPLLDPLTPREVQVLELLAEGLANKAIAERLTISDQTVKFHVASIYGKLGAANRTDAVRRAVRRGLITL